MEGGLSGAEEAVEAFGSQSDESDHDGGAWEDSTMNHQEMTPRQRLHGLASGSLAGYKEGALSLRRLVDDLDTVWNGLEHSGWSVEFRGHWWTLEQIYSVALDRDELDSLSSHCRDEIAEAVAHLEALLASWPDDDVQAPSP